MHHHHISGQDFLIHKPGLVTKSALPPPDYSKSLSCFYQCFDTMLATLKDSQLPSVDSCTASRFPIFAMGRIPVILTPSGSVTPSDIVRGNGVDICLARSYSSPCRDLAPPAIESRVADLFATAGSNREVALCSLAVLTNN
jgi:hypothetical protein